MSSHLQMAGWQAQQVTASLSKANPPETLPPGDSVLVLDMNDIFNTDSIAYVLSFHKILNSKILFMKSPVFLFLCCIICDI